MAQQTINVGAAPNDGTGTPLRTAFQYTNSNFSELYTAVGPSGNNIVVPGSATITGNLTVDTSTLVVNPAGYPDRVGIGTATPANTLDVNGAAAFTGFGINANPLNATSTSQRQARFQNTGGDFYLGIEGSAGGGFFSGSTAYAACLYNAANTPLQFFTNGTLRSTIDTSGNSTWYVGGSTAMTLNSTGFGVGVTPAAGDGSGVFKAAGTGVGTANTRMGIDTRETTSGNAAGIWIGAMNSENTGVIGSRTASGNIAFQTFNGSAWGERMRIDYLGNVGIGVTPSAWFSSRRAVSFGGGSSLSGYIGSPGTELWTNTYLNAAGNAIYVYSNYEASRFYSAGGAFVWENAPNSGASGAGTAATLTPRMTLDASGNLILLSSNTPATLTTNGQLTVNATSNTNLRFSYRGSDGVTRTANLTLA